MDKELFEEQAIYAQDLSKLSADCKRTICETVKYNQAVGFLTGYYDEALTISSVSDFLLHNLGYTYEEFMQASGGSLRNIFHPDNITFLELERFKQIRGAGEGRMLTKNDGPVYVHMYKEDTCDTDGKLLWVLSTHIDEMQQNLHLVNEVINSGFWYIDCDENGLEQSISYSHEFRRMLGYHDVLDFPNEMSSWTNGIHPDDRARVLQSIVSALADTTNQTRYDVEYRMRLKDGSYQWFRDSAQVTRRADGTAVRMAGIFINVTKQHELTEQNNTYDILINGTVKLVDRYAVCNLLEDTYKCYSRSALDLPYNADGFYTNLVSIIAQYFKLLDDNKDISKIFAPENLRQQICTPDAIYRFEYCTKDETQFKSIAISPLSWKNGELETVLFLTQDITQSKLLEIASRRALKDAFDAANKASQAKTDFLSNMSHDIRTPMNAIVGMTAIAGANIGNQERVLDCLSKITQSSRHLLGLINEVLDMSRIESGKIALNEEEFNLSDLVDNLVTLTKPSIEEHHHELSVHISHIEHEEVCGDSLRIQQLITNILSNAVKYTPDGGKICFSIAEIPTNSPDIGGYEFTIEDNGIGMTKEFQQIMFEPFTRADDKRTTKIQGTGLGMAIAKNIVNMMNGNIYVDSEPGKGSKFRINIFLKLQKKEQHKIEELINLPVLVVDDDIVACESTQAILEDIGISGEYVTTGAEAVERATKRHERNDDYFAIIIDWKMPGMDGIETTRRIRQHVGKDVTIIILSAYDYSSIEAEARAAGVDEFIAKPLFRSRLTAAFRNIIEGKPSHAAKDYLHDISKCDYHGKRILLVEDNALNSEIAKTIIGMTGAEIFTASDGREAVDMFIDSTENFYDLIFMDIQMPIMNGYEATAAIRSLSRSDARTTPIVAMTANAFAEDVQMAKNAGMNEHVAKPLDLNKLYEVLNRWL